MSEKYTRTRLLALLCSFVFVFSLVMTGCGSVKKVQKKDDGGITGNDVIQIGPGGEELPEDSQIVVGEDGQSYIVDSEGNSVVYNPTSAYIIPGSNNNSTNAALPSISIKPSSSTQNNDKPTTTTTTTTKTTTTKYQQSAVYNAFAIQRKFGFNKAYDSMSGLVNFYIDNIRAYFTYNGKDWLIELWKGEYAWGSVGCEIGYYYRDSDGKVETWGADNLIYKAVADEDAMYTSMELWQYKKATDAEPVKKLTFNRELCWWAAAFENGYLETHSDRTTLVMRGTIEFPDSEMRDLFIGAIKGKGFKEGSTSSYKNTERYSVNGNSVTIMWKNYEGEN